MNHGRAASETAWHLLEMGGSRHVSEAIDDQALTKACGKDAWVVSGARSAEEQRGGRMEPPSALQRSS